MEAIKHRERILEAIDQLRRRKARPDIQRICNYLFRKFSISSAEARANLQWCVDHDIVLKVEYKGSISYRNAAKKFSHLKVHNSGGTDISAIDNYYASSYYKANRKFAQLLTNAFGELVVQEPDYLEYGVPSEQIISHILAKDSVRYTKKYISILIEKEVDNGGLIRMDNDNYLMGPNKEDQQRPLVVRNEPEQRVMQTGNGVEMIAGQQLKVKKKPGPKPGYKRMQLQHEFDERRHENGALRVGGRRKRAKKVFDPSDTHIPRKRGRPVGSLNKATIEKQTASKSSDDSRPESRASNSGREQGGVCSVCHLQINTKKGPNDRMISCKECSNKAHYNCLNNGDDMMLKIYPDSTWQCPHCKTCVVCYETADAGVMVVCSICADAYHTNCHHPKINDKIKPNSRWLCINCEMPQELKLNEIQTNMSNTTNNFTQKSLSIDNDDDHNSSSPPLSGISSPYQSPPMSPSPSHHSQQHIETEEQSQPNGGNTSDSLSNRDSDDENIDLSIPDASHWSVEDVYQYFAKYFPEEAHIFREQEVDGRSLLLLRRMDVLTNLGLKLGPALKIYRHVVKLQVRKDDPKYYWF